MKRVISELNRSTHFPCVTKKSTSMPPVTKTELVYVYINMPFWGASLMAQ